MELLQDIELRNKTVFLRVDFNVPMTGGKITDTYRIRAAVPTIKFLVDRGAKVVIGTHCGRPEGKKTPETSIKPIAIKLQQIMGHKIQMAPDVVNDDIKGHIKEEMKPGQILVLENLRWDSREEANDLGFAKELAGLTESENGKPGIYVNDAFAVSHRENASVVAITQFLPSYAGLLMQSEMTQLSLFLENPAEPFVLIIGGVKVKDKAGMIEKLGEKADKILVGGGVGNTFLKAKGENIGQSAYDEDMVDECRAMIQRYGNKLVMPVDGAVEKSGDSFRILDIGEETRAIFTREIARAKAVFWNGSLGKSEDERYQKGMVDVATALSKLHETTVVAGGDTVGFIIEHKLEKGISFLSTGGGAALEYLAGVELPGIAILEK
ncbi:MAG TPA: phosphoglycerate kinase [bacterium]|mgnify:CR=1 FL=1|nr:phosphoglycerate kinase [bacterium]